MSLVGRRWGKDVFCGKVKLIRKKIATWMPRNRPTIENLSPIPTPTRGVEGLPKGCPRGRGGEGPWKETAERLNLEVAPLCWPGLASLAWGGGVGDDGRGAW